MKATTILAVCLLLATALNAQNFEWVKPFGGAGYDEGKFVTVDFFGNIYTTGGFVGTIDFDPGPGVANLTAAGYTDVFVQKMDASGNFLWAKSFGGTYDDISYSITTDASGNVYTTGFFRGIADFDPGAGADSITTVGGADIFVQKMDASGNFIWAKSFGGSSNDDVAYSIDVDASGNVYTTGYFQGMADFDPGAGSSNLTLIGLVDIFVQKMDASGNFIWAKSFGGSGFNMGYSVTVDALGNVYNTGYFQGTADFDSGAGVTNLTSVGAGTDIFVQKMDASGNLLWAKSFGGATSSDYGYSIAVDASGNIYTTGYFYDVADFDPGVGSSSLTSAGDIDIFVQKMDASGNFLWAKSFGELSSDNGYSITVDASGNVYTTGYFQGTIDFDFGTGVANLTSVGAADVFIQKMDSLGNFVWAKSFGGLLNDYGYSIAIDASGNIYTSGYFQGTVDFDPGVGTNNLTSAGNYDIFIHKINKGTTSVFEMASGISVAAYPNPNNGLVQISFENSLNNVEITLTNVQGQVVYTKELEVVSNEQIHIEGAAGVYFLSIKTPKGQSVVKLIKE